MKDFKYIWVLGIIATALLIAVPVLLLASNSTEKKDDPWDNVHTHVSSTDHSNLLEGPFETGSDVTRACLECHEDSSQQVMQTTHWTWQADEIDVEWSEEPVSTGKANVINNFCIGVQSNWPSCTACHAGYGWEDENFDFTEGDNVDCLACHAQIGYVKGTAGNPVEGVDLLVAAQSVALPTRENCGSCHFNGGGGDAVKHGDLDQTLFYPDDHVDFHMGQLDFQCVDCHVAEDHLIDGRSMSVSVDNANQVYCTDCHATDLHEDDRINSHVDNIACQTCHIPTGAVREATKMSWDWSDAGNDDVEESIHEYLKIKGTFVYEDNFMPEYAWYNGVVEYRYLLGDVIDPNEVTIFNPPSGDIDDSNSKIWPFKIHRGEQPYDTVNNYFLQPQTVGEEGYWTTFDWDSALELGSEIVGMDYSGEYGFAPTEMYWNLSHMVQPAHHALQCNDCHGDNGRMDWEALGYYGDPIRWGGRNND
jgi:octaheme c-type cytochrome (tetrathionate reductase family)